VDCEKPSWPETWQSIEPRCWLAGDLRFEVCWTFLSDDARNVDPFCRKGFSPQGEPLGANEDVTEQRDERNRCRLSIVQMHTRRGKPRSPARQAGPTEIRDCTGQRRLEHC
jgi:hypothetical protein